MFTASNAKMDQEAYNRKATMTTNYKLHQVEADFCNGDEEK